MVGKLVGKMVIKLVGKKKPKNVLEKDKTIGIGMDQCLPGPGCEARW